MIANPRWTDMTVLDGAGRCWTVLDGTGNLREVWANAKPSFQCLRLLGCFEEGEDARAEFVFWFLWLLESGCRREVQVNPFSDRGVVNQAGHTMYPPRKRQIGVDWGLTTADGEGKLE
jgi:hypothetical protein